MKMKLINSLLLVILLDGQFAWAQNSLVRGILQDSISGPLSSATVLLLRSMDSTLVNFTVSRSDGAFEFRNLKSGNYLLRITYVGYRTYYREIKNGGPGVNDLGVIRLLPSRSILGELTIVGESNPVTVNKDTIEFNAPSFKTTPNASVEDLLKKMPGIEVRPNGKIIAEGEEVKKVTVEGKPFFGDDPTLATRNLPADAIARVQLYNRKSDQANFTGIDDGIRQKAINLELKKDHKKGLFGTLTGGAGTNSRFKTRASINRFNSKNQVSFLGLASNNGEQGFSMDDYMNFTGGMRSTGGGGAMVMRYTIDGDNMNGIPMDLGLNGANGIITSYAGGLNSNNSLGKNFQVNASYFLNYLHHDLQRLTDRENFLPSGNFNFNQNDIQSNNNINQRLNFLVDQKIDSFNTLKFTSGILWNKTRVNDNIQASNTAGGLIQNASKRTLEAEGENWNLNPELLFRHNFGKQGRTFSAGVKFGLNTGNSHSAMNAVNTYFSDSSRTQIQNQKNLKSGSDRTYQASLGYTDRVGMSNYIQLQYRFRRDESSVDQDTWDLENNSENFDPGLSNKYKSAYTYNNYGVNYRIVKRHYNLVAGGSYQLTSLVGYFELSEMQIRRNYSSLLPVARFNYDFSTTRHLSIDYETGMEEPSLLQLQPVINNTDPLNVYVGNPSLRPAYNNRWRLNFNAFSPSTSFSLFGITEINYKTNAIVNSQIIDASYNRTLMPVNVRYDLSGWSNVNLGIPLQKINSRFDAGTTIRQERGITLINHSESPVRTGSLGGNVNYQYSIKDFLNFSTGLEVTRQNAHYGTEQPARQLLNSTLSAGSDIRFRKRFMLNASFEFFRYLDLSSGYRQDIPMLNLYASVFVFRLNRGELRFSVQNLLNKSVGISQTNSPYNVERDVTNTLGRYFMVSFTYALNRPLNTGEGGNRFIRIIR